MFSAQLLTFSARLLAIPAQLLTSAQLLTVPAQLTPLKTQMLNALFFYAKLPTLKARLCMENSTCWLCLINVIYTFCFIAAPNWPPNFQQPITIRRINSTEQYLVPILMKYKTRRTLAAGLVQELVDINTWLQSTVNGGNNKKAVRSKHHFICQKEVFWDASSQAFHWKDLTTKLPGKSVWHRLTAKPGILKDGRKHKETLLNA